MLYGLDVRLMIPQLLILIEENRAVSLIEFYFIK